MNAINREFKVGERYRGLVSGHVFTVEIGRAHV